MFKKTLLILLFSLKLFAQQITVAGITDEALANVKASLENSKIIDRSEIINHTKEALKPFGYFNSQVTILQLSKNNLSLKISPGRKIRLRKVSVMIVGAGAKNQKLLEVIDELPINEGAAFSNQNYKDAKSKLLNLAEHEGYIHSSFDKAAILIFKEKYYVDINIIFNTGSRYYFGPIFYDPQPFLNEELLEKYIPFKYNDTYSTEKILKLNNSLAASGYFSSVVVKPKLNLAKSRTHIPVYIHTQAIKRYSYTVGAGFGTDTGVRGRVSFHANPVNVKGHKFDLTAQGSQNENALLAQYSIPGADPLRTQYILAASAGTLDYGVGQSKNLLATLMQRYNGEAYNRLLSLNSLYEFGKQRNSLYEFSGQRNFVTYPRATYTFSKLTDPLFTPTGYNLTISALGSVKNFAADFSMAQANIDLKAAITWELIKTRFYFHGITAATAIDNITQLPLIISPLLGGNDNLRAYSFKSIGPGRYLTFGSLEIQKEIKDKWYFITFVDAGDVFNPAAINLNYDAGAAIMWLSPLGPIKVGFAQAINNSFRRLNDSKPRLIISTGPDLS